MSKMGFSTGSFTDDPSQFPGRNEGFSFEGPAGHLSSNPSISETFLKCPDFKYHS